MTAVEQRIESEHVEDAGQRRRVAALIGTLVAGAFVMILNETVMGVALPAVMEDFGVTAAAGQWLTTIFMLTMAIVIPMTGFLLQRFSARAIFIAALVLFTIGTGIAAFAPAFWVLLVARVAQASGTAVMMPLLTTTILSSVAPERRGRMMGLMAIVISVAPALGPPLSGFVITLAGWRAVFLVVLPIAVLVLVVGAALIRGGTAPGSGRFDILSVLLSTAAFGGLLFGLGSIGEAASGHGSGLLPVVAIAIGALALALFVWRQLRLQRTDAAMLDLRTFTYRPFWVGIVLLLVAMASLFGALILLPLYLQNVRGLAPLDTGLVTLPGALLMGIAAPFIGALFDRVGPRPLVIPGSVVLSSGLLLLALVSDATPIWGIVLAHVTLSAGLALMMTPLMTSALGSLPPRLYSHGSATTSTLQQFAGALGTAVFVTIMSVGAADAASAGLDPVAAQGQGIHLAFVAGAVASLLAIVIACFVRRPAEPAAATEAAAPSAVEPAASTDRRG